MSRVNFYVGYALPDLTSERKFYGEIWGLVEVDEMDTSPNAAKR